VATTILLVDDHPLFRKGLRLLLEEQEDFKIVGEAGDGREAMDGVRTLSPDVVIMDITMPDLDGIDATRQILSEVPSAKVVALSMHAGNPFVEDMLQAGAAGYILKQSVPEDLVNGIRIVIQGDVYLSPAITGIVVSEYKELMGKSPSPAQMTDALPILRTKLHRPTVERVHVHRPYLLERLEQGLQHPLTLVSAPAGYGKTLPVACWLEASDMPSAWVSLDEGDNQLRLFLSYLLTAIQTIFPDAGQETLGMVNSLELPPPTILARTLTREIDRIEQSFVLVLDDLHLIDDESVLDLLHQLLRHPPRPMHLVLICRRDPLLPISSLRAKGLVTEIRTRDLRFNQMETKTLLTRMLGTQVDDPTVAVLVVNPALLEPHVDAQHVMEYLFREVFSLQSPEIIRYLMSTAILDRFCGPLCEAVCVPAGDPPTFKIGGREFIAWLREHNLFLSSLDKEERWFRFHHLFQKLLLNELNQRVSQADINDLHAKASAWFAENGLIEEALKHALSCGSRAKAAQLIARHGYDLLNEMDWPRLDRWLKILPGEMVDQEPDLLVLSQWLNVIYSRFPEIEACLNKAKTLFTTRAPMEHVVGHIDVLKAFQHAVAAEGERSVICARRARKKLPREHQWARMFSLHLEAAAHQSLGDREKALAAIEAQLRDLHMSSGIAQGHFQANQCFIHWMEADLKTLLQAAGRAQKTAEAFQKHQPIYQAFYFMGIAYYHRNEIQAAEENLISAVKEPHAQHALNFAHGAFALALVYQALGRADEANKVGESVVSYGHDTNHPGVLRMARAFQAELALRQGRLAEASYWAEQFVAQPFTLMYRFYVPELTLVRVLLAQDTRSSREQAAALLKQLYDFVITSHNRRFQIDVLALQALFYESQGKEPAALKSLTKALQLAEPGGFIRLFADLGPQIFGLLKQLVKQNVALDHIGQILAAFRDGERAVVSEAADRPTESPRQPLPPSPPSQPLVEPLTSRELDVLQLLAKRMSNKEIAAHLFISPKTVKKHLDNIYGKLNVSGRRESVEKAVALGILRSR